MIPDAGSNFDIIKYCSLAYTEACIREIMRYETLLPNGQAHVCLEDTEFMGYDIPKVHKRPLHMFFFIFHIISCYLGTFPFRAH